MGIILVTIKVEIDALAQATQEIAHLVAAHVAQVALCPHHPFRVPFGEDIGSLQNCPWLDQALIFLMA